MLVRPKGRGLGSPTPFLKMEGKASDVLKGWRQSLEWVICTQACALASWWLTRAPAARFHPYIWAQPRLPPANDALPARAAPFHAPLAPPLSELLISSRSQHWKDVCARSAKSTFYTLPHSNPTATPPRWVLLEQQAVVVRAWTLQSGCPGWNLALPLT